VFNEDKIFPLSGRVITTLVASLDWLGPSSSNLIATLLLTTVFKRLFATKLVDVDLMILPILTVGIQAQLMDLAEHARLD